MLSITYLFLIRAVREQPPEPHTYNNDTAITSHEYELVDRGSDGVYSEITAIKTRGKKEYSMSECVAYAPTREGVA